MAPQMKGLHAFISDLRNASDLAEERRRINAEIHNIRQKYSSGNLDSYSKKKYLCKLLYIHLSGLPEDASFGLSHAYDLLNSSSFSEKQLGYLAVSVLYASDLGRESGSISSSGLDSGYLTRLVSETHVFLVRDLAAHSDDTNILALQFIASKFNVPASSSVNTSPLDTAKWCQLLEMVYGLCVSPVCTPTVKMRALVAVRVMATACPSIFRENGPWFPRLLSLLDEPDLGVVVCSVPVATTLTTLDPRLARALVPQVAALLVSLVIDENCPRTYRYYDVPAPWLVAKLFQLAEHLFTLPPTSTAGGNGGAVDAASLDSETLSRLRQAVSRAINNASRPVAGQSDRNARSAVLFQAVALAPFLDASPAAIHGAIHALAALLSTPETNTRYLVMAALIKLCVRSRQTAVFSEYLPKIQASLEDRDVSVRRKTLDLLFSVCDANSYVSITACLLDYFPHAEAALRSDVSVKVAILAERFATDALWYVSTMLRLLALGASGPKTTGVGSHAGEVWERITQIIVNNPDLHKMAAKYVVNTLRKTDLDPPESVIKVAAFVLGEFGHTLVAAEDVNGPYGLPNQVRILRSAYLASGISTRPLVLSAFLKLIARYPHEDFVPDILDLFDAETSSLDLEIQTRAHEYLKLATWLTSGDTADATFARSLIQPLPPFVNNDNTLVRQLGSLNLTASRATSSVNVSKIPGHRVSEMPRSGSPTSIGSVEPDPFGDTTITPAVPHLSPNWYDGYHRMLQFDVGIFYEDQLVKLTYRISRDGPTLKIIFTIINNAAKTAEASISAFTVHDIHSYAGANYVVTMVKAPDSKIPQKSTMELEVKVCDVFRNNNGPILAMSYKCSGSFNTLTLKIPVVLTKTLSGTSMSSIDDFKKRWLQIGEMLGLETGEKRGLVSAAHRRNSSTLAKMLQRLGLAIIQCTPDDPHSNILVMGAGILRMVASNCGVLVTVKSVSPESNDFDVIVRSTGVGVPAVVHDTIRELLDLKH